MLKQQAPKNFVFHNFKIEFFVAAPCADVFAWLLKKETFSKGQLPPYKVEFLQKNESENMQVGDLTNHHGPLIQFAGILTEIEPGKYRKLDYAYGSYALSFRWARPACLEITTTTAKNNGTLLKIELKTYVHPFFAPFWKVMMFLFWNQFAINVKLLWLFRTYRSR